MGLNFHSANGHKNYHDNFNGILANESTFRYLIIRKKNSVKRQMIQQLFSMK